MGCSPCRPGGGGGVGAGRDNYPGLLGRENEEQDDVDGLYEAADPINGDKEERVCLDQCVVDHQHGAEESYHVRHRLEALRRPLLAYPVKRRPEVPGGVKSQPYT